MNSSSFARSLPSDDRKQKTIAIVGSGMAGLTTAYLLNGDRKQRYNVKVFEMGDKLSLDAASLSVNVPSTNTSERLDVPMRAFAGGFYKNLIAMYAHLHVDYQPQPFLFAFSSVTRQHLEKDKYVDEDNLHFLHSSNSHKMPPIRPRNMSITAYIFEIIYLLFCYAWFSACCFIVEPNPGSENNKLCESFGTYLRRIRLPWYFTTCYLLPLLSSVTTCPHDVVLASPASDLVNYKRRTHRQPHYTVKGGMASVQSKLCKGLPLQLSARVFSVVSDNDKVQLAWQSTVRGSSKTVTESFDSVVLAVSPNVARLMFEPLSSQLSSIPTTTVQSIVNHDLAGVSQILENIPVRVSTQNSASSAAQTILFRTIQNESSKCTESIHVHPSGVLVTTTPVSSIHPSQIIQSSSFTRVLRTPHSRQLLNKMLRTRYTIPDSDMKKSRLNDWKNGDNGVWLAGGWCWDGMVLLEGCIVSAMRVADAFDVEVPWRYTHTSSAT